MKTLRLTDTQLRVYKLLREGNAQSLTSSITGIPKGTVSKIASKFVKEGYLNRATDKQPYLFEEGPLSKELDAIIAEKRKYDSLYAEVSSNATGVKQVSSQNFSSRTIKTHHIKVRFRVEKIGDMEVLRTQEDDTVFDVPFLEGKPYFNHNNVTKWKGKLHCPEGDLSVEFEETPSVKWFYIFLPTRHLIREEIRQWKDIYLPIAQSAANHIQKYGGWRFGLMEFCPNWLPHFASEDTRIVNSILDHASASNGEVWTSTSQGHRELETSREELAELIISMPEAIYELKIRVADLVQMVRGLVETDEGLLKLETSRMEKLAAEAYSNGHGGDRL